MIKDIIIHVWGERARRLQQLLINKQLSYLICRMVGGPN